jgi:hypothetical protein
MNAKGHLLREILVLLAITLNSCTGWLPPASSPSGSAPTSEPGQNTPGEELTFDEQRGSVPPAPQSLRVEPHGNAVQIAWTPGARVMIPHTYADDILLYKVFRRAAGQSDVELLGKTTETHFLDSKMVPGKKYYYFVVEVHRGFGGTDLDSGRSDEVLWRG